MVHVLRSIDSMTILSARPSENLVLDSFLVGQGFGDFVKGFGGYAGDAASPA